MSLQNTDNGRAIIEETADGLKITIPVKRNYTIAILLAIITFAWLKSLLTIFYSAMDTTGSELTPFIILFFFGVTAYYMVKSLVWLIAGNEIIVLEKGRMTISYKGLLFSDPKAYLIDEIKQLKTDTIVTFPTHFDELIQRANPFFHAGVISFTYGMQTIRFAGNIDAPEAEYLLQIMVEKGILKSEQIGEIK